MRGEGPLELAALGSPSSLDSTALPSTSAQKLQERTLTPRSLVNRLC